MSDDQRPPTEAAPPVEDRPAGRVPRRRPQPAQDANMDPADVSAAAPPVAPPQQATVLSLRQQSTPAPVRPAGVKAGPQPAIQLNIRIDMDYAAVVDRIVAERGWTKRFVIEHALKETYGLTPDDAR